eukprot:TRINITY_DN535_c1_g1_i1.p1 TRINITY_DN535_c1_g1~~TRINITY_DN535_c1_g1_i1.p1  ORF type:complete len:175 (-),score=49.91 TRINITY_DN535_c1_g1_i1:47-571(-)
MKILLYEKKHDEWNEVDDFFVEFDDNFRLLLLISCENNVDLDETQDIVHRIDINLMNFSIYQTTALSFGNFHTGQRIMNFVSEQDLSIVLKKILTIQGVIPHDLPECCYSGLEEFHSFVEMIDDSRVAFILAFENDGNLFNRMYSIYTIAKRMGDSEKIQMIIDLIFFFYWNTK